MTTGIVAFGAYVPRRRLARKAIADTHGWFAPGLASLAKGERAMANWDEDAVTMAVEAARDALTGRGRDGLSSLRFASTTGPFVDRLHAGLVAEALDLGGNGGSEVHTVDVSTTQRAGTSALLDALLSSGESLVVAAENRRTKAASPLEMATGDGAAAIVTGSEGVVAKLIGRASASADFVDHFRSMDNTFDYQWEERWVRDAGYLQIVPPVIARCLAAAKTKPEAVTTFCLPSTIARVAQAVAKAARLPDASVADTLAAVCGDTGVAHPLVMLVAALETAKPGDKILVVGFGQGADALLFEVTPGIAKLPKTRGVAGHLARRKAETSYGRFLAFNDLIEMERGMRAETDKATPLSSLWRNRKAVTSFIGGKCSRCGTNQFPKSNICVNPNCNAVHTQEPQPFAETEGRILSFTSDRLTYSPDPPALYGMIQFAEGGRCMMDFTDMDEAELSVDKSMRMMFRVKDIDANRGFRRYFWKATPA